MSTRPLALFIMTLAAAEAAPRILVHGHRGARAVRPENTMAAFEYAIESGVDVLELDLAVTADNVLVASHDPVLPEEICVGPAGTRTIREMTLERLRQFDCGSKPNPKFPRQKAVPGARVPTLDEVLALAPRGVFEFNIETKIFRDRPALTPPPAEFARLLVEAIRRHGLEKRVMIQSFDFRTLQEAARIAPEIRRSALYAGAPRDLTALAREAGATILSPHHSLVNKRVAERARAAGLHLVPWTANTPAEWDRLIEARVDAIITDDPAALIGYLKARGRR